MVAARRTPRLPAHTVDLLTRVTADLHTAGELGTARGDLALTLAAFAVDEMRSDGPRVAAMKQLAELLSSIGTGSTDEGDGIDRIVKDRAAAMADTISAAELMAGSLR